MARRGMIGDVAIVGAAVLIAAGVLVAVATPSNKVEAFAHSLTGGDDPPAVPLPGPPPTSAPSSPVPGTAAQSQITVQTDATGRVVGMLPQTPLPSTAGSSPASAGQSHLAEIAQVWRVDPASLRLTDIRPVPFGTILRYQQTIGGRPVFGGQIVQALGKDGSLVSAVGKTTSARSGDFPVDPSQTLRAAGQKAVSATADAKKLKATDLSVQSTEQYWWDPTLGGVPGTAAAKPVYVVHIRGTRADQQWSMVVGANRTDVVQSWSETREAVNRDVCDARRRFVSGSLASVRCGAAFPLVRTENGGSSAGDVGTVFKFFGDAQNFYARFTGLDLTSLIGADYGDGTGKAIRGTVRICMVGERCPFLNAFWDGEQMAFGEGVTTEDITGHELTHGVTQHTSGLQGGLADALNEGMSDVFGKFIGITTGDPNDSAANRWLIGAGSAIGAIRDMRNPQRFQQPDRVNGPFWVSSNPDPHANDGVVNKAAFLITDGAGFNGQNVRGLGVAKAVQVWFGVENLLTPRATFQDLGNALAVSCRANQDAGVAGITADDCAQVAAAVTATQLDQAPR
ncbi:M4 family metallopeptidase [Kutzneria buriramensis]|uniref:Neutral metalloproteinase n=1 Tax=Kutzneria buriramensis TaxID=1045776 RepID=A0A3E0HU44_9PSEU|nr:M4 family metallopeptidase [Kutzneria buriramensis]REH49776.1 Zn-dependent metalloprotease [Kutzneria buriramensis]